MTSGAIGYILLAAGSLIGATRIWGFYKLSKDRRGPRKNGWTVAIIVAGFFIASGGVLTLSQALGT